MASPFRTHVPHYNFFLDGYFPEGDAMGQTDVIRAGREQPLFHPVETEMAFAGLAPLLIKGHGPVRAGF
jgi:hypothetical protein